MRKHSLTLGLLALSIAAPAHAFWPFGPSNAEDCIERYAEKGVDTIAVRAGIHHCRRAFDPSLHKAFRNQALCIAKEIPELRAGAAVQAVAHRCGKSAGIATCPVHQRVDLKTNACIPAFP